MIYLDYCTTLSILILLTSVSFLVFLRCSKSKSSSKTLKNAGILFSFVITSILLFLSIGTYFKHQKTTEINSVYHLGKYELTYSFSEFNNPSSLTLKENNTYTISDDYQPEVTLETGKWELVDDGEFALILLSTPNGQEQLGFNRYSYLSFEKRIK